MPYAGKVKQCNTPFHNQTHILTPLNKRSISKNTVNILFCGVNKCNTFYIIKIIFYNNRQFPGILLMQLGLQPCPRRVLPGTTGLAGFEGHKAEISVLVSWTAEQKKAGRVGKPQLTVIYLDRFNL